MNHYPKILSAFALLLTINFAFANGAVLSTNGTQTQEQEQELGKNNQQLDQQKLDGESQPSSQDGEFKEEEVESTVDTVKDDSVSKYNFIFYLLYKYKFEEEA